MQFGLRCAFVAACLAVTLLASVTTRAELTPVDTPTITDVFQVKFDFQVAFTTNSPDATSYLVQWYTNSGPTTTQEISGSPFIHKSLTVDETYYYRVAATNIDDGSFSGYSDWTNATQSSMPGPVSWYRFRGDTETARLADAIGDDRNLIKVGSGVTLGGDGYATFSGFTNVVAASYLQPPEDLSSPQIGALSFWVLVNDAEQDAGAGILTSSTVIEQSGSYHFMTCLDGASNLQYDSHRTDPTTLGAATVTHWHHVVMIRDNSQEPKTHLWLNGVSIAPSDTVNNPGTVKRYTLGADWNLAHGFAGSLANVKVFKNLLTQDDVDILFAEGPLVDAGLTPEQTPEITDIRQSKFDFYVHYTSASNATGYLVQWYTGGVTTTVSTIASPYQHKNLTVGETYTYRVGATNVTDGSFTGYSDWAHATLSSMPGPVSWYTFRGNSETERLEDKLNGARNLVKVGAGVSVPGDGWAEFAGFANAAGASYLLPAEDLNNPTIGVLSFWVRVNDTMEDGESAILTSSTTNEQASLYHFMMCLDGAGSFEFGSGRTVSTTLGAATIGHWHHVVMIRDMSVVAPRTQLWLDGVSIAPADTTTNPGTVKRYTLGADWTLTHGFAGALANVKVFKDRLTQDDVDMLVAEGPLIDVDNGIGMVVIIR